MLLFVASVARVAAPQGLAQIAAPTHKGAVRFFLARSFSKANRLTIIVRRCDENCGAAWRLRLIKAKTTHLRTHKDTQTQ